MHQKLLPPHDLTLEELRALKPGAHLILYQIHRDPHGGKTARHYYRRVTFWEVRNPSVSVVNGWRTLLYCGLRGKDYIEFWKLGMAPPPRGGGHICAIIRPEHMASLPPAAKDIDALSVREKTAYLFGR